MRCELFTLFIAVFFPPFHHIIQTCIYAYYSGCKSLYGTAGAGTGRGGIGQPQSTFVGQAQDSRTSVGGFYTLYDEALETALENSSNKDDDEDRGGRGRRGNKPGAEWR